VQSLDDLKLHIQGSPIWGNCSAFTISLVIINFRPAAISWKRTKVGITSEPCLSVRLSVSLSAVRQARREFWQTTTSTKIVLMLTAPDSLISMLATCIRTPWSHAAITHKLGRKRTRRKNASRRWIFDYSAYSGWDNESWKIAYQPLTTPFHWKLLSFTPPPEIHFCRLRKND
jgi:hypothetical protein